MQGILDKSGRYPCIQSAERMNTGIHVDRIGPHGPDRFDNIFRSKSAGQNDRT